jgi:hypothetical protein
MLPLSCWHATFLAGAGLARPEVCERGGRGWCGGGTGGWTTRGEEVAHLITRPSSERAAGTTDRLCDDFMANGTGVGMARGWGW